MFNRTILAIAGAITLTALTPALHASEEYIYVESNIASANGNSIFSFQRQADGSLKQLPGSPFPTGGAGIQDTSLNVGPSDSDQNIVTNPSRTLLFAVNSGSDTIAAFHIHADGTLAPVDGSPFPSGGTNPVSLALRDNLLFVVNKNGDFPRESTTLPNYTTMLVGNDGALAPNPQEGSTASVALNSSPTQAYLVPNTSLLFGADFLGGLLQTIRFDWAGRMQPLSPQPLPASAFENSAAPRLPLGLWSHPRLPLLYVGFVTASKLGVYHYDQWGSLSFIRAVPNTGAAICWLRTNSAGTRLYSTDTITNSVSVYDLSDPENPVEIQNLVLSGVGNVLQFSLSTDEQFLYALSSRGSASIPEGKGNILHVLKIASDGTVAETDTAAVVFALPAGTRPQGVLSIQSN